VKVDYKTWGDQKGDELVQKRDVSGVFSDSRGTLFLEEEGYDVITTS